MPMGLTDEAYAEAVDAAHRAGIKLEIFQGLPIWEFLLSPMHTIDVKRIDLSIRPAEGCHSFKDMSIRFPDGSIRRPDIAIFCRLPEETRASTTLVPEAVIELVSPGSEMKDLQLSPGYYLGQE